MRFCLTSGDVIMPRHGVTSVAALLPSRCCQYCLIYAVPVENFDNHVQGNQGRQGRQISHPLAIWPIWPSIGKGIMGQTCIVVNSHLALLVVIADVRVDIILVWGKPGSVDSRGQWDKGDVGKLGPWGVDKVCTDGARGLWDVALP